MKTATLLLGLAALAASLAAPAAAQPPACVQMFQEVTGAWASGDCTTFDSYFNGQSTLAWPRGISSFAGSNIGKLCAANRGFAPDTQVLESSWTITGRPVHYPSTIPGVAACAFTSTYTWGLQARNGTTCIGSANEQDQLFVNTTSNTVAFWLSVPDYSAFAASIAPCGSENSFEARAAKYPSSKLF